MAAMNSILVFLVSIINTLHFKSVGAGIYPCNNRTCERACVGISVSARTAAGTEFL